MYSGLQIRNLLRPGDRRTVAGVAEVVRAVRENPRLTPSLVNCLFDENEGVRMRAADALEKISRQRTDELQAYAGILLGLFEETEQQEVQWHLAVLVPRLQLNARERHRTAAVLRHCMESHSSIVKAFALQGLFDMAEQDPSLVSLTYDLLTSADRTGTPAMKARSRKLLRLLSKRMKSSPTRLSQSIPPD